MSEQHPQSNNGSQQAERVVRLEEHFNWRRLVTALVACALILSLASIDACL